MEFEFTENAVICQYIFMKDTILFDAHKKIPNLLLRGIIPKVSYLGAGVQLCNAFPKLEVEAPINQQGSFNVQNQRKLLAN